MLPWGRFRWPLGAFRSIRLNYLRTTILVPVPGESTGVPTVPPPEPPAIRRRDDWAKAGRQRRRAKSMRIRTSLRRCGLMAPRESA